MYSLIKPYIFNLDPEVAHDLAIKSLKFNFVPKSLFPPASYLEVVYRHLSQ